jgi:formate dehydrogenase subunit gamma
MVAMTPPSEVTLRRFSVGEKWIHRTFGALMLVCIVTAALLYFDFLSTAIGHRQTISTIHFFSGLLLPVPIIVGLLVSADFRRDVSRLNRFSSNDWQWLKSSSRRAVQFAVGKFNAGQKLNSAFVLGTVIVMLVTGLMLRYFGFFADSTRTGATFVHDAFAFALVIVSIGHIGMAWADPGARRGLRTGFVSEEWAQTEHPAWAKSISVSADEAK